jgi:hypothetical protein
MRTIPFLILVFVAAPRAWGSQAPGAPVVDPSLALAAPADEGAGAVDPGAVEDPHADRTVLLPTALTQPAGSFSISSYELVFAGLTYGITDRLQVSTTVLLTPFMGTNFVVGNLKWQVLRHGSLRLSINAGVTYLRSVDDGFFQEPGSEQITHQRVSPHLGATVSHCLTDDCQSLLSASVQILTNPRRSGLGQVNAAYGASLISRITEHTKLVLEVTSGSELNPALQPINGALPTAALRYFNQRVAFDGGVMGVAESGGQLIPIPYVAGSFRF